MTLYRFAEFELDDRLFELKREGRPLRVEAKVLDLLIHLVRNRERVVPKRELLDTLWRGVKVGSQSVPQAVYAARKLLGDDPRAPRVLETVRGRGVRFVARVRVCEPGPASASARSSTFVGRRDALTELHGLLAQSRREGGRLLLIAGEAGIGKSRLVSEFVSQVRAEGGVAWLGRCPEAGSAPPWWPWVQLLRAQARHGGSDRIRSLLERAPVLESIAPGLGGRPAAPAVPLSQELAGPARFQLFDAITHFWGEEAQAAPLVLALDDLHRADELSRALLLHLAHELSELPLLLVGTHREPDARAWPAWDETAAALARAPATAALTLHGLTRDEVASFLAVAQGRPPEPEEVAELHERSSGNPFFLTQLVRVPGGEARGRSGELPRTLSEAIAGQLQGLPPACRSLLTCAAVFGREFRVDVLEAASGVADALAVLAPAMRAGVVAADPGQPGRLRFEHILIRDVLYSLLSVAERTRIHASIAEALEATAAPDSPEEISALAHHFFEAVPLLGPRRALVYAERAGRLAAAGLAFAEAAAHLERAVRLAAAVGMGERELFDLLLALGEAQARAYQRDEAREAFRRAADLARRLAEPERLARVALGISPGFFAIEVGVADPLMVSLLEDALALLPAGDSQLRARVQARLAMTLYWSDQAERRRQLVLDAEAMAERLGETATLAHVLCARIFALWSPDNLEERFEASGRLVSLATGIREWELALIGRVYRITCLIERGELREMEKELDAFERSVADHALPQATWYVDLYRGTLSLERGDLADAEERVGRISRLRHRSADSNIDHSLGVLLTLIHWRRGDASAFVAPVKALAARYPAVVAWRTAIALVAFDARRDAEVAELIASVVSPTLDALPPDVFRLAALCVAGELCAELAMKTTGRRVRELLAPYAGRYALCGFGSLAWGSISRVLGRLCTLLGDWDEAERHFEAGEALESRAGSRAWLADSYREHARMLLARGRPGDRRRALRLLESSLALGREMGVPRTLREAERLLQAARKGSRDPRRSQPDPAEGRAQPSS
jgi:DNA-binding winged helix-turn-helix (wHTH) protein/tetratricopeptide (TPR) repeat protein